MKKYRIYIALLLFLSASCTDDRDSIGQDNGNFRVTASIENTDAVTRVADNGIRTSFAKNDEILIGWSGSVSYKFLYSGANNNEFNPNDTDKDRGLWSDMLQSATPTVDVYAWYGTMNSSLPMVGTTVSIPQDQTSESKLLSAICMAAHQSVSPASTYTLNFSFQHLTARLALSVDIVDPMVAQVDVMGATAQINNIYAAGTIAKDATSGDYKLNVRDDKAGTESIRMKQSWSDQEPFHLDFECLLPPQTLGAGQSITITLANGKEYVCSISGDLTLQAGYKKALSASLKAEASADFKPKLTRIPDAANSAYSGNRLICCISNSTTGECRYRVYDKQPDGSWGEGDLVYKDEEGQKEFLTASGPSKIGCQGIDISGDYAVISTNLNNNSTYFIKKSKGTGKWYCAKGNIQGYGYSVCISNDFLVSGNHPDSYGARNRSYIYPIDEDGNLGAVQDTPVGISAYKCSIYGGILATNSGVYEYNTNNGQWEKLFDYTYGDNQRVATDGKRVIMQDGSSDFPTDVYIYNVATRHEESWEGAKAKATVNKPIAIYGDYALAGTPTEINICYRNPATEKWSILNPDGGFLEMIKHWDKSITITTINGENISMKGTRAMIVDPQIGSIFIENIDKMVEDYLADSY